MIDIMIYYIQGGDNMLIKKLMKVGTNSKCIVIDKNIIELLGIEEKLTMEFEDGKIILTPIKEDSKDEIL
jgi:hypothetical protein